MRLTEFYQSCPHCGGPAFSDLILAEKKDACYHKVKASAKVWPSAYASGRLVQCRKKGAANYGNKSEGVAEGVRDLGYDAQSLIFKLRRDVEEKRLQPTRQAVLMAARELAGDMDFAPELLVRQVLGQSVAEAQLDEKCWDGYQQQGMKNKGGRQVPNCVPTESVAEGAEQEILFYAKIPDGSRVYARVKDEEQIARLQQQYRAAEIKTFDFRRPDILDWLEARGINLRKFAPGMVQTMYPGSRGHNESKGLNEFASGSGDGGNDGFSDDTLKRLAAQWWHGDEDPRVESTLAAAGWEIGQDEGYDEGGVFVVQAGDVNGNSYISWPAEELEGLAEDYNPEYDDEAGMADNNLETLARAVEGIDDLIQSGDNLPEWCQEKIAVAKSMLVAVWDYMYSEEASDEVDPEIDAMFEAMEQLVHETAHAHQVSVDLVWESFEALDDHMLYETAAWRRKEGKSAKGGLNAKGVASYRRENPGSKLQMAVTTKPSKLKPGSKAAKRRKSFCARMGGVKGPMKKPNGKPTRKALALRKWNC